MPAVWPSWTILMVGLNACAESFGAMYMLCGVLSFKVTTAILRQCYRNLPPFITIFWVGGQHPPPPPQALALG